MTGSVDLGPGGLLNLRVRRLYGCDLFSWCPLPVGGLLAVLPDGPVVNIELRYTPQGRRLFIQTRFGRYKVYQRKGRTWRVKKVPE